MILLCGLTSIGNEAHGDSMETIKKVDLSRMAYLPQYLTFGGTHRKDYISSVTLGIAFFLPSHGTF